MYANASGFQHLMAARRKRRPDQLPGGRHGLPAEDVVHSQRTRLLEALLEVVAENGYQAARVSDFTALAGVSRKTFYELFSDKEDCFLAAYDWALGRLLTATAEAYESSTSPWPEKVHRGVSTFLTRLAEHQARAKVCIVEVLAAGPKAVARRDAAIRGFTFFIDEGRGETAAELPAFTALAILGGLNEILYTNILNGRTAELPRLAPDFVYWITLPFLGAEVAAEERKRSRELRDAA
jgi:AcrR family transcriptional regulator